MSFVECVKNFADGRTESKTFVSRSSTLTESEISECSKKLEKLKISPAENEENRMLIARAERVFEESLSDERRYIVALLSNFKNALQSGNSHEVRASYNDLTGFLDKIES